METIKRKTLIYRTGVEYGDYTINHIQGCSHGCKYPCYAMMMAKRFGRVKTYEEWCKPKLVENTLEILMKEIPKYKEKVSSVHLCFSTDPFMYQHDDVCRLSIEVIKRLNEDGIACTALTKGLLPFELSKLSWKNEYGITLISLNEDFRQRMEPYSAPYKKRIAALKKLHEAGCKTWVSIEPYPTPNIIEQNFFEILENISFVNKIIFGKLNYNTNVSKYSNAKGFFNSVSQQVIKYCKKNNKQYHIKNGTITGAVPKNV